MEVRSLNSPFKKEVFICCNSFACTIYYRNLLKVSKGQVKQRRSHKRFHGSKTTRCIPHTLSSENGKQACLAVDKKIKLSPIIMVWCKSIRDDETDHSVGLLQRFKGGSRMSFSAMTRQFSAFHIDFLEFSHERQSISISKKKNVALLPTRFDKYDSGGENPRSAST